MKRIRYFNYVLGLVFSLMAFTASSQTTVTIGTGTSSSNTYGPIYRSSASSSFDYSRYHYIFTAAELSSAGISPGSTISSIAWNRTGAGVMTGGDATLKIYVKNSSATVAASDTWANLISGSSLVVDDIYNTTNNLPAATGYWTLNFAAPFTYTGGALEVSIDWDCSAVTGSPTTGAFNWEYGSVGSNLATYANNSTQPTSTNNVSTNRANTQFTYTAAACPGPTGLAGTNFTATTADLSWAAVAGASNYNWKVVAAGAGSGGAAVSSGTTAGTSVTATGLTQVTNYDLYVQSDCGGGTLSLYSGPYSFSTPPTCPSPVALTTSNLTTTSVVLGWTAGGTETTWDIEWGTTGFTQGTGTMITGTTTKPYPLSGLTQYTGYSFYVRADCGGSDVSTWTGPYTFFTGYCQFSSTNTASYFDAFTTTGGATNISNTSSGYATGGYQDATAMVVSQYATGSVNFTTTLVGTTVGVAIWVDWNNDLVFDVSERMYNTAAYVSAASGTITVPAGTPIGNYRMRAVMDYNATSPNACSPASTRAEAEDYTFAVIAAPSCLPPTTLAVSNTTATSTDLGWTENGTATAWNIEWGTAGFTQGAGTTVAATTNPYALTGLSPNTAYSFYVQADCGGGTTSTWAGPFTFTTSCVAFTVPYFEGFESGYTDNTAVAGCLSQESVVGTEVWTANNTETTYNRAPYAGAWNAFLRYSNDDWLFIPIDLTAGTSYTFECYARQDGATAANSDVAVSYGTANNAASMTNTIVAATGIVNGAYQQLTGSFTPATTGTYYIGIKGYMNSTPWYISLDNISVIATPTCPAPNALTASNITATSADVTWAGTAASFEVQYGAAGFTLGTGMTVTATTTTASITGLTFETNYDFYVRAVCAPGDTSPWSGVGSFFTGYCTPAPTSVDGTGIINVAMGGVNNTTGAETGNYGNYSAQVANAPQGGTLAIDIGMSTGSGYFYDLYAFVDWNNDLDFDDAGEEFFLGTSVNTPTATLNGSIMIPGTASGNYRIRIGGYYVTTAGNATANPCYTGAYAAFEDYTLSVSAVPLTATTSVTTPISCNGAANGVVKVTAAGGLAPYTYAWDVNAGSQTDTIATALMAGTYSVTVTDANSNTQVASVTIAEPAAVTVSAGFPFSLAGTTWKVAPQAQALGVGPTQGNIGWWSNSLGDVTTRACFFDDEYVFNANGTFSNVLGVDTWLETWQGVAAEMCGTPVAPHNGTAAATWAYDAAAGTITINGTGAYLGLAKVNNAGELPGVAVPSSITYLATFTGDSIMTLDINFGPGFWRFVLNKTAPAAVSPITNVSCNGGNDGSATVSAMGGTGSHTYLWDANAGNQTTATATGLAAGTYMVTATDINGCTGTTSVTIAEPTAVDLSIATSAPLLAGTTWKVAPQAQALGVGPTQGDIGWWSNSLADVTTRACFFDDEYVFNANGTFSNVLGTDTWIEGWQGGTDACGTPVAPHDGSAAGTWAYDPTAGTITVNGTGAYLGLAKVHNSGELTSPANAVSSITYLATFTGTSTMTLDINFGTGWWRFVLNKTASQPPVALLTNVTCNGGNDGSATVSAIGGTGSHTYLWDANAGGQTTATATGLAAGTYMVTATDANGCTDDLSVTITEPTAVTATTVTTDVDCNGNSTGTATVTAAGGTAGYAIAWSNGDTATTLTGLAAGTYTVSVTDANGCSSMPATAVVNEPALLVVTATAVADTNNLMVGQATATISGGTTPYTSIVWDNGMTGASISGLSSGAYTVTVTDANGCTGSSTVQVDSIVTSISNIDLVTSLKVFPNPTVGNITIDLELSTATDVNVTIYDVAGQLIKDFGHEYTAKTQIRTDLSIFPSGVYFVRCIVNDSVVTKRLILTK